MVREIAAGTTPRGMAVGKHGRTIYVSDSSVDSLLVIDVGAARQIASLPVGKSPEGVDISADGGGVSIAAQEANDVVSLGTRDNSMAHVVHTRGRNPGHAVFSPDGRHVFASAEEGETVDVIDKRTWAEIGQVTVGARPRGIGFLPDGSRAYVAAGGANAVYVIDVATLKVTTSIKAGLRR